MNVRESSTPIQISASQAVLNAPGTLLGIFVSSASSSPTIKVYANTAASGSVVVDTFTPVAGTWYPLPFRCATGCYVAIGGTVSCTVGVNA